MAIEAQAVTTAAKYSNEFVAVLQWAAGVAFSAVIFYTVYILRKIDANQSELFRRINCLERDFNTLRGEHDMAVQSGIGPHKRRKGD